MKAYTNVSRKVVGEDRIAICPQFGCDYMKRVKPLKFGFLGFEKYPKCKTHHLPLVYVDERIGEFVDGALACLFDKAGLPPSDLLELVASHYHDELDPFVHGWVYCVTTGRGAPIVSRYLDSISKAYMKNLNRKQVKAIMKDGNKKDVDKYQAVKKGLKKITAQYTRLLKHLRAHSEVLVDIKNLKSLSRKLRNDLNEWQEGIIRDYLGKKSQDKSNRMTIEEVKYYYDQILNVGTCRSLLGMKTEFKKVKITAFDRFSAYVEFFSEGITEKYTKSDIKGLYLDIKINPIKKESIKKMKTKEKFEGNKDLKTIKEYLRNLDWKSLSNNWVVLLREHHTKPYEKILLDPHKDPSNENPLWKHEIWLKRVYADEKYDFSDSLISRITGISRITVRKYRLKFNISYSYYNMTQKPILSKELIEKREKIRNFNWKINTNWMIPVGGHGDFLILNPSEYCSPENPLYKHKVWLKRVYEDEELDLNGVEIAKICGLKDQKPISYWRKRLGIHKKRKGVYINTQGQKVVLTPNTYTHPQRGRVHKRAEHKLIMERYLNKSLSRHQLETHPDLIQGLLGEEVYFYIKKNCHVHHINYVGTDNRIENLWLFSTNRAHGLVVNELHQCLSILIKLHQIFFKEGKYFLNQDFDCRRLERDDIRGNLNFDSIISHYLSRFYNKSRNSFSVAMPASYKNPFISLKKGMDYAYIYEHRYIIEQYYRTLLRKNTKLPEEHNDYKKAKEFINPQGFLKPDALVHHVNFDSRDNRISNLYVCNISEHRLCHGSIYQSVERLLDMGLIYFCNGKYFLDNTLTIKM
ncbi:MAG: hypothetical protein CEE42_06995 [Promethearchaeota archaeon Loki_b31]|nr:MAG: hypothetical protein CEE42_06995 [Candidatus Lokiarchaeota archaeon Loki_b31]